MAKKKDDSPRLKKSYYEKVVPALRKEFSYTSLMQVPKIEKIVVSMGVGDASKDKKLLESAVEELSIITGQKPIRNAAKRSISNFKIREGMLIGTSVTLRGDRMYEFLDRLVAIALPRVKDFRGVKRKSFDGNGNYSLGIKEQIVFPEIRYDKIAQVRGLNIAFSTTAKNNEEAFSLLSGLGMPFERV